MANTYSHMSCVNMKYDEGIRIEEYQRWIPIDHDKIKVDTDALVLNENAGLAMW